MATHAQEIENKDKEIKKLTTALKESTKTMKIMQKQLFLNEEHFLSANIKSNEKILDHKHG